MLSGLRNRFQVARGDDEIAGVLPKSTIFNAKFIIFEYTIPHSLCKFILRGDDEIAGACVEEW